MSKKNQEEILRKYENTFNFTKTYFVKTNPMQNTSDQKMRINF